MFFRLIKFALQSLWRRKLRTILSIFGVMIGIVLITIMVALGLGLQNLVVNELRAIPSLSAITVTLSEDSINKPAGSQKLLTNEVKQEIEKIPSVKAVHPIVQFYALLSANGKNNISQSVLALDPVQAGEIKISAGTSLADAASKGNQDNVVLVAPSLKDFFGFEYAEKMIGQFISIKLKEDSSQSTPFRIVGIMDKKGSIDNFDLIMPLKNGLNLIGSSLGVQNFADYPVYNRLQVEVNSFQETAETAKQIKALGFEAISLDEIIKKVVKYFRFFELGLGVFGLIVLGVAAMGIMNMMVISIYERTREIGVLKAVGARSLDVIKIFSLEASLIGLIGGILGVLISFAGIEVLQRLADFWIKKYGGLNETIKIFSLPIWLVLIIIGFAVLVGFISGIYPAIRAARMDPVKALREK